MEDAVALVLIGFAVGALLGAAGSIATTRRFLRRARLAERRARAAQRMAEIGGMTGGLAHEIKNPLSTIGLNAQLLAEAIGELGVDEADKSRLLNRTRALRREADRLRDVLADFLQFAGQIHLTPQAADLNEVVQELVDFYLPETERRNVRMRVDPHPAPLKATFDVKLVKQAVLNLMINAVQAMEEAPPDGRPRELILRTRPGKDPGGHRTVVLHMADTGPGIAPDAVERIFTPYFSTKSGGSGLGLPTARRLIEQHNGRIDLHSEPGRGTEFVITLPAEHDAPS